MFNSFPAHAQPAILRIWQEAYGRKIYMYLMINAKFVLGKSKSQHLLSMFYQQREFKMF